jgi:hypothetical protein
MLKLMARMSRVAGAVRRRREAPSPAEPAPASAMPDNLAYLRLAYRNNLDWYAVSERKAQILLALHGALISVAFGSMLGVAGDLVSVSTAALGSETWAFLGVAVSGTVGAVVSGTLCMWSLHGRSTRRMLARLGVDPRDAETYVPEVLWYFGHLGRLDAAGAADRLRGMGQEEEVRVLSFHIVELSQRVLRKHRWMNAGWAFTGLALVAVAAALVSLSARLLLG